MNETPMLVVPFPVSDHEYSVFVILQDGNIERIKSYDPAEVLMGQIAGTAIAAGRFPREVIIGYATAEEIKAFADPKANVRELLRNLSRGFKYRPDKGDSDAPYKKAR